MTTIPRLGTSTIVIPSTIASAAPSAAPEATPKVSGETKGFARHPCINEPAVAKATPPITAIKIRGNRNFQIISDCKSLGSSIPKRIFAVVHISRFEEEPWPKA